jgi:hypothetical protein
MASKRQDVCQMEKQGFAAIFANIFSDKHNGVAVSRKEIRHFRGEAPVTNRFLKYIYF